MLTPEGLYRCTRGTPTCRVRGAAAGAVARRHPAARAPGRRPHGRPAARRPDRARGADHHTATGRGFTEPAARATRGWRDEEAAASPRSPTAACWMTRPHRRRHEPAGPHRDADRRAVGGSVAAARPRAHRAGRRTRQGPVPPAGRGPGRSGPGSSPGAEGALPRRGRLDSVSPWTTASARRGGPGQEGSDACAANLPVLIPRSSPPDSALIAVGDEREDLSVPLVPPPSGSPS